MEILSGKFNCFDLTYRSNFSTSKTFSAYYCSPKVYCVDMCLTKPTRFNSGCSSLFSVLKVVLRTLPFLPRFVDCKYYQYRE